MQFRTGRQFGLGNRKYTLTKKFEFIGRELPENLTVDGSSVPKVPILFISALALIFIDDLHAILEIGVILTMLLVGICESSGWFMKPAAVHDHRFQEASTAFGWISANFEYYTLMTHKILMYSKESEEMNGEKPNLMLIIFHSSMGFLIATAHFVVLTMFGWIVWYSYYFRTK